MFKIIKQSKKGQARLGKLKTAHGEIQTPFFLPIATKGAIKNVSPVEIKEIGAEIILANTYHLYLQPGYRLIKTAGGLHKFINWNGPILTDSGGFQVFSLGGGREGVGGEEGQRGGWRKNLVRVSDEGVEFKSYIDGSKHFLTPELAIEIQRIFGSDIMMILDQCLGWPCTKTEATEAMKRTLRWAERSKKYEVERMNYELRKDKPLIFGIVQGSIYKDLRIKCAKELVKMDFDGYAIGGLAVGEPRQKMFQVLDYTIPLLPKDKPRYLMGVGRPEEIVEAVKRGIDMFDCVIPTREARHGRIYLYQRGLRRISTRIKADKFYMVINITNSSFRNDFKILDPNCDCPVCKGGYSRAYLHHLFKIGEGLGLRLASLHNLRFYLRLMELIRNNCA